MADLSSFVKELNSIINPVRTETSVEASRKGVSVNEVPVNEVPVNEVPVNEVTKKVKILIVSTHVNQVNGYSKVIYNIIKQLALQPWIEIVHFATQKMGGTANLGRIYPQGVKVVDATALDKDKTPGFAFSELSNVINSEKPNIVFIYNDLSIICSYIEEIRKAISQRFFKIWTYVDMTYLSPPQATIDILNRDVERIFCFTTSWKNAIKSQGITRPVDVMNHGVDSSMFRSIPKELARQSLGLPKDIFLFTSLNRNIPRKRLDLLVMSFVTLITRFPTKPIFLLMVSDKGDRGGFQLFDIFARELKLNNATVEMFGNRLMLTSKDTCYRDEDINMLYNCGDAGISCAEGEGFGLCTFEQMAVGVPQIVPEINGYTEYCTTDNSLLIKPSMRYYIPQVYHVVTGEAQSVHPEMVAKEMERYVFDESLRKLHGKLGKETTTAYTWEKCVAVMLKRLRFVQEEDE